MEQCDVCATSLPRTAEGPALPSAREPLSHAATNLEGHRQEAALPEAATMAGPAATGELLRSVHRALEAGEVEQAQHLIDVATAANDDGASSDEWLQVRKIQAWTDTWLLAAVRREPPLVEALDALAERYWKMLYSRCELLTLNRQKASDLAQEAWCKVLRTRHRLNPTGNFPAYLTTIAMNLWRDWCRADRRAGAMADGRLASLDAAINGDDSDASALADHLPDLNALRLDQQKDLKLDIDEALAQLTPQLREVIVARFIAGESCAEIGQRFGRTEQTISGWVRQAVRILQLHFGESRHTPA